MSVLDDLRSILFETRNPDGGWGYYRGKTSRLEPTCWAILAIGADSPAPGGEFLARSQQSNGWLVEQAQWPVNIGFNALVALTWMRHPELATDRMRRAVVAALAGSKGIKAQPDNSSQDNSLQGWSWIDGTFSWVEPTSWGMLALKRARKTGAADASVATARIEEAERLLLNRVCRAGGWNFGNAAVMQQDLRPYVPTTALGLLAVADRRGEPAVAQSLAFLAKNWETEPSPLALSLSLICLDAYGQPADAVATRLVEKIPDALRFGNTHAVALTRFALVTRKQANAFSV